MSDDERSIRDLIATWMAATKTGDLATIMNLMSDDVVFMVPGRCFGKEAFAQASHAMEGMRFDGETEILEIEIYGTRAWTRTRLKVTATPPEGEPIRRSGYALTIFRKEMDGSWVLARDANLLASE